MGSTMGLSSSKRVPIGIHGLLWDVHRTSMGLPSSNGIPMEKFRGTPVVLLWALHGTSMGARSDYSAPWDFNGIPLGVPWRHELPPM